MAFMQPEVTGKQDWVGVETTAGFWWVPFDVLSKSEAESARKGNFEPLLKYTEGSRVHNDLSSIKKGYGVRLSAPGYMDASEWEVYGSKQEALRRGRELAREAEGDHATKKAPARQAPKSSAQLDREIAHALGAKQKARGGRAHATMQSRGSYPFDLIAGDVVMRRDIKGRKKYRVSHLGNSGDFVQVYAREVGGGGGGIVTFDRSQLRLAS